MTSDNSYSVDVCNELTERFRQQELHRPMRVGRFEPGTRLTYDISGVAHDYNATVHLVVEKFVGGGFAGQVYRVKVEDIQCIEGTVIGLEKGKVYAVKILIPPSGFSRFFRNVLFYLGFQGPFQLQVNPTAARAGALWQKFIRRGAAIRFNNETAVNDIHATFVDATLGSCGEISDWVDGRTWRLEVDDRMDLLKRFNRGKAVDPEKLGSPEYRAKKVFMKEFVKLLQDMGAHEFARQYEWSTCKSQPNCLKRSDTENDPAAGLMAVDFRAGLALLPLLPMSPGDVKLIFKGIGRGSLVQFDRGSLKKLAQFVNDHKDRFADMLPLLDELKQCEDFYRNSLPDITHNHVRLLFSRKLWTTILKSARTGWRVKNTIDDTAKERFDNSSVKTLIFYFLGIIPILGRLIRKVWGHRGWRKHYGSMLSSWNYLQRSFRAKGAEKVISWHRSGRLNETKARKAAASVVRYMRNIPLSILPAGLHRMFTDWAYAKERLHNFAVRPIKLYFSAALREQWLKDMVSQGQDKHILSEDDAAVIHSQLNEPFIQKYLKSLAVHVATLPVTQVVSVIVSWLYVRAHPELSSAEAAAAVAAILVLFQITPISPGSLVRGLYVVYMMIKDRSFKDYNIAVFLGFFKYIGYLAFPIQMTYRYPELARFMAGHWATEAVHVVPVFGEGGALLEHWVFRLFYNWPLTIRRRMRKWAERRETLKPRYWHVPLYVVIGAGILTATDHFFAKYNGVIPTMKNTWWIAVIVTVFIAFGVTRGCRGAALSRRIISAALWGAFTGAVYMAATAIIVHDGALPLATALKDGAWWVFLLTVLSPVVAIIAELRLPEPEL